MPVPHLILVVVALVLLGLATVLDWPRGQSPAPGYGHPLAWAGLAFFVASTLVS